MVSSGRHRQRAPPPPLHQRRPAAHAVPALQHPGHGELASTGCSPGAREGQAHQRRWWSASHGRRAEALQWGRPATRTSPIQLIASGAAAARPPGRSPCGRRAQGHRRSIPRGTAAATRARRGRRPPLARHPELHWPRAPPNAPRAVALRGSTRVLHKPRREDALIPMFAAPNDAGSIRRTGPLPGGATSPPARDGTRDLLRRSARSEASTLHPRRDREISSSPSTSPANAFRYPAPASRHGARHQPGLDHGPSRRVRASTPPTSRCSIRQIGTFIRAGNQTRVKKGRRERPPLPPTTQGPPHSRSAGERPRPPRR